MRDLALACVLAVVVTACAGQDVPVDPTPSAVATAARSTATAGPAGPTSAVAPSGPTRYELVAELAGAIGPAGVPPAAGEISCRGRVVMLLDMRPRPPLALVTVTVEIEMDGCPEGTVITDGHVHEYIQPHPDKIYVGAGIARPSPLTGGGVVTSTNQGVDPRRAAEVIATPERFGFFLHTERNPNGGAGRGPLRSR